MKQIKVFSGFRFSKNLIIAVAAPIYSRLMRASVHLRTMIAISMFWPSGIPSLMVSAHSSMGTSGEQMPGISKI